MRLLIVVLPVVMAQLPDRPLAPWGFNHHPTDVPKSHVEPIAAGRQAYTVRQGGTMDGANCRSPVGVGMADGPAIQQTWESNRTVRLENVGETNVVNPWLSNGRNGFRTLGEIVSSAVEPGMTDREKAFALWFQEIRHRYHAAGDNVELGDPVKVFNVYGHNTCGNDSICLAGLWKRAGLKVTPARVVGHCVSQAYFDGRWNLFDGDMHSMYLLRDNRTVACEQDLVRDHDLVKRSHTQGILNPDRRANDEWQASIYVFEGAPDGDRNCVTGTNMNMVLRPGEAIAWRWGHADPVKYLGDKPRYPDMICNGLWEYRPDFSGDLWKKGAAAIDSIQASRGELTADEGKAGAVVWIMRSPYVFVGGRLEVEGRGAKFSLSWDGKTWTPLTLPSPPEGGEGRVRGVDLGKFFPPNGPARYEYRLRCELAAGARLKRLGIVNDLQMAPLALPAMSVGENKFVYTDQSPGERKVRITHDWVERSVSRPPYAPPAPAFPSDGGEADGTDLAFRWLPAKDPDGDRIADYHFELADRPDMKWPLSTNFYKLISNTPDRGKEQYTLPQGGLLASGQKYYWRVRAKNEKGVWGSWSATWSFTPRGPSSPVEVTLAFDPDRNVGTLRWKPNPAGRKPAKYRIYGSDEKGFSISDEPSVGQASRLPLMAGGTPAPRQPTFVTEVAATEAVVIGAEVTLTNANRAFYRVVAVDAQGKRSGPSDFAEAPRPILYSRPVTNAQVGSEYRYALSAIRSLGDVRTRVVAGKETMNYWDVEAPRFALQQGPPWLKVDAATGVLSGVPDRAGKVAIVVTAAIDREVRNLDARMLSWGLEKVVSTGTQRVGVATQKFTMNVAAASGEDAGIIAPGAKLEKLAGSFKFTEGPAVDADGNVYFTDQPNDRIHKWSIAGKLSTFLEPCGRANGLCFDGKGNLWACADEKNELWSIDADKKVTVVVKDYKGKLLNGPNDLWIRPDQGIYFTDPYYKRPYWKRGPKEQDVEGVYYLSADRKNLVRVIDDLKQPNGIIGTPDGKILYVADIGAGLTYAYEVKADGSLTDKRLFCKLGSDGMTIDNEGNVYLTGKGVTVFDRTGKQIEQIPVPALWTANVCFGGRDRQTLFITAMGTLYGLKMRVKGVGSQ